MLHSRSSGLVGALLATSLATWSFLAHPAASGTTAMAGMVLLALAGWLGGVLLSGANPMLPGMVVAALVTVAVVLTLPASLSGGATAPPLGYANASAALISVAVVGALSAAGHAQGQLRSGLLVWGAALAAASLATGSRAVAVSCLLLVLLWHGSRRGSVVAWQIVAGALLTIAVLVTVLLGATRATSPGNDTIPQTVGSTRVDLWADAVNLAADHPVRGVGPGEFSTHSPTAGSDPDLVWAHSTPLQVTAETGLIGLGLLVALAGWMVVALGRGAIMFAVLALQPMVDYILTFPAVTLGAGLVLGALAQAGVGRPGFSLREPLRSRR